MSNYNNNSGKQFDSTNRGVLFTNDRKANEKHPDYAGKIDVDGTEWEISGWIKTGKSGKKFMSLSVKPPWKPQHEGQPAPLMRKEIPPMRIISKEPLAELDSDSIPF